jgi:Tol biopolymer transport system component
MRAILFRGPLRILAPVALACVLGATAQAFTLTTYTLKVSTGDLPPASGPRETSPGPRYSISDNGCRVVFTSTAKNLIAGQIDGTGSTDVFLYEGCGTEKVIALVSHQNASDVTASNGISDQPVISPDGNFVVFRSTASDIVEGSGFGGQTNVFLWDSVADSFTLISHGTGGATESGDGNSQNGVIFRGGGGRSVAFESVAKNLDASDGNGVSDVFLSVGGVISRVSVGVGGEGNGESVNPAIDASGNCVVYESAATNLVSTKSSDDNNNAGHDVFLWKQGATSLVSHIPGSLVMTGSDASSEPSISDDCKVVGFKSAAKDLSVGQNGNSGSEVFYEIDPSAGTNAVLVSHQDGSPKDPGDAASDSPILSRDGNWLAYASRATNLAPGQADTALSSDVFVYDIAGDKNTLVSHTATDPKKVASAESFAPEISIDGLYVAFESDAKDIDPNQNDGNGDRDLFLYNRRWNNSVVVSRRFASIAITGGRKSYRPALSGNGNAVAFTSSSADLIADDPETSGFDDTFLFTAIGFMPFVSVRSTESQNFLEWITPAVDYVYMEVKVTPTSPCFTMQYSDVGWSASLGAPVLPANSSLTTPFLDPIAYPIGTTRCYGIFIQRDTESTILSADTPSRTIVARTLDAAPGPVKWGSNVAGVTSLAQVGIGAQNVIAVAQEGGVYGLERGPAGGFWSSGYWPFRTDFSPIQGRPGVLTLSVGGATHTTFVGSQDGRVYAFDADRGARAGGALWYTTPALGGMVQPGVAGMFTVFGGVGDHLLVGTRSSPSQAQFFALDPATGAQRAGSPFTGGGLLLGDINTTSSVDYNKSQVCFASFKFSGGADPSLWCLQLTSAGIGSSWWSRADPDGITAGPVERNGKVYVGDNSGQVWAFDASAGTPSSWDPYKGCGLGSPIKSYILADRLGTAQDLYYASSQLCALSDLGASVALKWAYSLIPGPSAPILVRTGGFAYLYVGSTNGNLYQIDATLDPNVSGVKNVLVRAGATIGAPAFDFRDNMIYVGTDAGAIYAVQVPLP